MSKKIDLLKNTFIIMVGKICTQFLTFFLLPLYTNHLSTSEYGLIDLVTTYVVLLAPVISVQLEMAIFRELIDCRDDNIQKKEIISTGIILILKMLFIFLLFFIVLNLIIKIKYFNYLIFYLICVLFSNVFLQITRGLGKNIDYSISCVLSAIITVVLNCILILKFNLGIRGVFLATSFGNLLMVFYIFLKCDLKKYFEINSFSSDRQHSLFRYSLPLVPNGLIWWIINVSDRTIISLVLGSSANGIYSVANKFSNLLIQMFNVFNLAWVESSSLHIYEADKDQFFSSIFCVVIDFFINISSLLLLIMPILFQILIGNKFYLAYQYIPILLIGMIFNVIVSFIGSIYISLKKTKEVAITSFLSGLINIIINLLFIKKIGIFAATFSTLIAFFIMSIYRFIDIQKYVRLTIKFKDLIMNIFLLFISIFIYYIPFSIFTILLRLIVGLVLFVECLKKITVLYKRIN